MNCNECGHFNDERNVTCEECGTPLVVKLKKSNAIDIEEIEILEPGVDFNTARKRVFWGILGIIGITMLGLGYLFYYLLGNGDSNVLMDKYDTLVSDSPLAIIYLGDNENIIDVCTEYAKNYDFDFLNIESSKLKRNHQQRIREELNIYNLSSTIVIVRDGIAITSHSVATLDEIRGFLHYNEVIPAVYVNTAPIIQAFNDAFESDKRTVVYFATTYTADFEEKSAALAELSVEYAFNYVEVEGFHLSKRQLLRKMSNLNFTEIQDNMLLYIIDGELVSLSNDLENSLDDYFDLLTSYGIIDKDDEKGLIDISFNDFEKLLDGRNKHAIIIGSEDCTSCARFKTIVNEVATHYGLVIQYLDVAKNADKISDLIKGSGYEHGLTSYPFTVIVEKGEILDYMVGLVEKPFFVEKLTTNGIIR